MGCNCADSAFSAEGLTPRGGDPGLVYGMDSRLPATHPVRGHGSPVLGPTLGGGISGSGIGSGVGRVGGGLFPPNLIVAGPDPVSYPQARVDFHFDYSTPKRIFERDIQIDPALNRELGGLFGGNIW